MITNVLTRVFIVAILAVFPAMFIGLAVPGLISAVQMVTGLGQPAVVDLSGPKTIRTCPPGMDLQTIKDTRPNYNRTGTVTTISYVCAGANGAEARPTETIEPVADPPQSFMSQNFFFSDAANWMRWLAYPVSFVLLLVGSFFVRTEPRHSNERLMIDRS